MSNRIIVKRSNFQRGGRPPFQASASCIALAVWGALLGQAAHADSVYWNGPASGNWFLDSNWVWDNHHPGSADSARIDSAGPQIQSGETGTVDALLIGIVNTGNLNVAGTLNSGSVTLGYNAGASGSIRVSGGSWTNTGALFIGEGGTGLVNITAAGTVTSASAQVGHASGSSGTVVVDGPGSRWQLGSGNLDIGVGGTGSLSILNGGSVTSGNTTIGTDATGTGQALVSGAGSSWASTGNLYVGNAGQGTLTIKDGGSVSAVGGYVATLDGSNSRLEVTGAGSALALSGSFIAGYEAGSTATVDLGEGGRIRALQGTLGDLAGSTGSMSVSGAGSDWSAVVDDSIAYSGYMNVGRLGRGTLSVTDGGSVTGYRLYIGNEAGSEGKVTLSGSGSQIRMDSNLYVGAEGKGELTLSDGAQIHAAAVKVGYLAGSTGVLNIGAAAGEAAAAAGTIDAAQIVLGDGDSRLVLNHTTAGYVLAPDIVGNGQVIVSSGENTFTGNNTYAGGTTLSGGTLTGTAASFGTGAIVDNAALVLDQAANATFGNVISGNGTLTKTGAGTLDLTSDSSSFSGATIIAAGELKVNGSIAASAVQVQPGARLSGSGTVGSLTALSGSTIAPGNSPGTLSVAGNYHQAGGATYDAEVIPGSATSDRIAINGTAAIDNGAILNVRKYGSSGAYALDDRYTVLTANGGVTGTYTLTGDTAISAFYALAADYDANHVYLEAKQTRTFASAAATANQAATAAGLQSLPTHGALRAAIGNLQTDAEARVAFDQLSGDLYSTIKGAMIEDSRLVRLAAIERLSSAFGGVAPQAGPTAATGGANGLTVWANSHGSWGHADGNGNAASLTHDTSGFVIGGDVRILDGARFGLLAGYSRATYDTDGRNATGSSDNYTLGSYGGTQLGALGIRVGTTYTWSDVSTQRNVAFTGFADRLSGAYDAGVFQAFGDVGYRIDVGSAQLEPFAGLAYARVHSEGFTERGGLSALTASSGHDDVTYSTLGLRGANDFTLGNRTLTVSGSVAWRHAWGDTDLGSTLNFAGSNAFGISGLPIVKDAAVIEAGLSTKVQTNVSLRLAYTGQLASRARSNGVRATLNVAF